MRRLQHAYHAAESMIASSVGAGMLTNVLVSTFGDVEAAPFETLLVMSLTACLDGLLSLGFFCRWGNWFKAKLWGRLSNITNYTSFISQGLSFAVWKLFDADDIPDGKYMLYIFTPAIVLSLVLEADDYILEREQKVERYQLSQCRKIGLFLASFLRWGALSHGAAEDIAVFFNHPHGATAAHFRWAVSASSAVMIGSSDYFYKKRMLERKPNDSEHSEDKEHSEGEKHHSNKHLAYHSLVVTDSIGIAGLLYRHWDSSTGKVHRAARAFLGLLSAALPLVSLVSCCRNKPKKEYKAPLLPTSERVNTSANGCCLWRCFRSRRAPPADGLTSSSSCE